MAVLGRSNVRKRQRCVEARCGLEISHCCARGRAHSGRGVAVPNHSSVRKGERCAWARRVLEVSHCCARGRAHPRRGDVRAWSKGTVVADVSLVSSLDWRARSVRTAVLKHAHSKRWREVSACSSGAQRMECGAFTAAFAGARRSMAGSHKGAQRHVDVELEAAGVWPSPAAATCGRASAAFRLDVAGRFHIAAPEDGRTPNAGMFARRAHQPWPPTCSRRSVAVPGHSNVRKRQRCV